MDLDFCRKLHEKKKSWAERPLDPPLVTEDMLLYELRTFSKEECIPVGCVPPASVAVSTIGEGVVGVSAFGLGGVCLWVWWVSRGGSRIPRRRGRQHSRRGRQHTILPKFSKNMHEIEIRHWYLPHTSPSPHSPFTTPRSNHNRKAPHGPWISGGNYAEKTELLTTLLFCHVSRLQKH